MNTNTDKYADDKEQLEKLDSIHAEQFVRSFFSLSDDGRKLAINKFNDVVGNCASLGFKIHA